MTQLGQGRPTPTLAEQAIVIGGSLAGMLAARVLASYFARVTIVDRDTFSTQPALRKGVPQAQHIHTLLARGARVLEELFPGFLGELSAAGATTLEWGVDNPTYNMGRWMLRKHTGLFSRMSAARYWNSRCASGWRRWAT